MSFQRQEGGSISWGPAARMARPGGKGLGKLSHGETKGLVMVEAGVDFPVLISALKTSGHLTPTKQAGGP